jgi:DNA-binding NarL/FixJ family response regulator
MARLAEMPFKARVVLADEHVLFTEGLQKLLQHEFNVVEVVHDGPQLIEAARRSKPDVVISNISLPILTGFAAARVIHRELPQAKLLFLSTQATPISVGDVLETGACGHMLNTATSSDLLHSLRRILAGRRSFHVPATLGVAPSERNVTPRQAQVLALLVEGLSTKCIAHALKISCKTVEYHKYTLMKVLGVTNTAGLIRFAIEHGSAREPEPVPRPELAPGPELVEKSNKDRVDALTAGWDDEISDFWSGLTSMLEAPSGQPVPMMHASLADFGKGDTDGMVAVCGYVASRENWELFNERWMAVLSSRGLPFLRTAEYLRPSPNSGISNDETIRSLLEPFTQVIREAITGAGGIGVCVITDREAYERLTPEEKRAMAEPGMNSFEMALGIILKHTIEELNDSNPMAIQFDESSDAGRLLKFYMSAKETNPMFRRHLGAIAFVDDKKHFPVQAANMLANLALKAWRSVEGGLEHPLALDHLVLQVTGVQNTRFVIYRDRELKELAARRMAANPGLLPRAGSQ